MRVVHSQPSVVSCVRGMSVRAKSPKTSCGSSKRTSAGGVSAYLLCRGREARAAAGADLSPGAGGSRAGGWLPVRMKEDGPEHRVGMTAEASESSVVSVPSRIDGKIGLWWEQVDMRLGGTQCSVLVDGLLRYASAL